MTVPNKYDGKLIRLQANYVVGIHGAQLGDRSCPRVGGPVWVSMSPKMWEELSRDMEKAYEMKSVSGPLDVVFLGEVREESIFRQERCLKGYRPLQIRVDANRKNFAATVSMVSSARAQDGIDCHKFSKVCTRTESASATRQAPRREAANLAASRRRRLNLNPERRHKSCP